MRYRTTITNKEDNSVGYLDYVWVDSKLISISFTSDELNQTVKYLYNDFDEPVGFVSTREDGSVDTYYYLKNAQGDITHIVSAAGKKMVSFTYDAWGKRTVEYHANGSTTPGQIELLTQMKADLLNPFAYRGYCYDYDMGMYYLQSRYYDPEVGRFINADDTNYLNATGTVLGCNLFAYCENDWVNFVDENGYYSAQKAIKYAKKYWNTPNPDYKTNKYDCANFVSQCLYAGSFSKMTGRGSGGWHHYTVCYTPVYNKWGYVVGFKPIIWQVSDAWGIAGQLFKFLINTKKLSYTKITKSNLSKKVEAGVISVGDAVFFSSDSSSSGIYHAAIVGKIRNEKKLKNVYYYAHTLSRNAETCAKNNTNGFGQYITDKNCIYVVHIK